MDTTIKFTGWSDGFDKVALNILLRQYADFGLKQAKNITDAILNNEYVEVVCPNMEKAVLLKKQAEQIGVICS